MIKALSFKTMIEKYYINDASFNAKINLGGTEIIKGRLLFNDDERWVFIGFSLGRGYVKIFPDKKYVIATLRTELKKNKYDVNLTLLYNLNVYKRGNE